MPGATQEVAGPDRNRNPVAVGVDDRFVDWIAYGGTLWRVVR